MTTETRTDFGHEVTSDLCGLIDDTFRLELDRDADPAIVAIRHRLEALRDLFDDYDRQAAEEQADTAATIGRALEALMQSELKGTALMDWTAESEDCPDAVAFAADDVVSLTNAAMEALTDWERER